MKQKGSGLFVWLNEQLSADFPDLVTTHDYREVVKQLEAMDDPRAARIAREFHVRDKADSRARAQLARRRQLAQFQKQLEEYPQNAYIAGMILKLQRRIAKAEEALASEERKP